MSYHVEAQGRDYLSWATTILAVFAAAFMVTVWAPMQIRALESDSTSASAAAQPSWTSAGFQTLDGSQASFAGTNGHVRIATLMYAHCPSSCPLAIDTLKRMQTQLPSDLRARLTLIALTVNPTQDTLPTLAEFARERALPASHWIVGRPSAQGVEQIAAGLGVSYRVLADGSVDHQSAFALLDSRGNLVARTLRTAQVDPAFLAAVRAELARP